MEHKWLSLLNAQPAITLRALFIYVHLLDRPSFDLQEPTKPIIMHHTLSTHSSIHNICYLILSAPVRPVILVQCKCNVVKIYLSTGGVVSGSNADIA